MFNTQAIQLLLGVLLGLLVVSVLIIIQLRTNKKHSQTLKELQEENRKLSEQNNELDKKLDQVKNNQTKRKAGIESYKTIPDEWKNTVYEFKKDWVNSHCNQTLGDPLLTIVRDLGAFRYRFVVHCKMVLPTKKGPKLVIEDPFCSKTTEPVKFLTEEDAYGLVGRILIVYGVTENDKIYVTQIKRTIYTKDGSAS